MAILGMFKKHEGKKGGAADVAHEGKPGSAATTAVGSTVSDGGGGAGSAKVDGTGPQEAPAPVVGAREPMEASVNEERRPPADAPVPAQADVSMTVEMSRSSSSGRRPKTAPVSGPVPVPVPRDGEGRTGSSRIGGSASAGREATAPMVAVDFGTPPTKPSAGVGEEDKDTPLTASDSWKTTASSLEESMSTSDSFNMSAGISSSADGSSVGAPAEPDSARAPKRSHPPSSRRMGFGGTQGKSPNSSAYNSDGEEALVFKKSTTTGNGTGSTSGRKQHRLLPHATTTAASGIGGRQVSLSGSGDMADIGSTGPPTLSDWTAVRASGTPEQWGPGIGRPISAQSVRSPNVPNVPGLLVGRQTKSQEDGTGGKEVENGREGEEDAGPRDRAQSLPHGAAAAATRSLGRSGTNGRGSGQTPEVLLAQLRQVVEQCNELQTENDALRKEMRDAKEQHSKELAGQKEAHDAEVVGVRKQLEAAQEEVNKLCEEGSNSSMQLLQMERNLKKAMVEVDALRHALEGMEVEAAAMEEALIGDLEAIREEAIMREEQMHAVMACQVGMLLSLTRRVQQQQQSRSLPGGGWEEREAELVRQIQELKAELGRVKADGGGLSLSQARDRGLSSAKQEAEAQGLKAEVERLQDALQLREKEWMEIERRMIGDMDRMRGREVAMVGEVTQLKVHLRHAKEEREKMEEELKEMKKLESLAREETVGSKSRELEVREEKWKEEVEGLKLREASLMETVARLKEEVSAAKQETDTMLEQTRTMQQEQEREIQAISKEFFEREDAMRAEVSAAKKELLERKEGQEELERQWAAATRKAEEMEKEAAAAEQYAEEAKARLAQLEQEAKQLKYELEDRQEEWGQEEKRLRAELMSLRQREEDMGEDMEDLQHKLKVVREQKEDLLAEIAQLRQEHADEVEKMERELKEREEGMAEQLRKAQEISARWEEKQEEIRKVEEEKRRRAEEEAASEIERLEALLEEMRLREKEADEEVERLREDLERKQKEWEEREGDLKSELDKRRDREASMNRAVKQMEEQLQFALEESKSAMMAHTGEKEAELEALAKEHARRQEALQEEVEQLREEVKGHLVKEEELAEREAEVRKQLQRLEVAVEAREERARELEEEIQRLMQELRQPQEIIEQLRSDVRKAKAEGAARVAEIGEFAEGIRADLAAAEEREWALAGELEHVHAELSMVAERERQSLGLMEELKSEVAMSAQREAKLEALMRQMQSDIEEERQQLLEEKTSQVEGLRKQWQDSEARAVRAEKELDAVAKEAEELGVVLSELGHRLEAMGSLSPDRQVGTSSKAEPFLADNPSLRKYFEALDLVQKNHELQMRLARREALGLQRELEELQQKMELLDKRDNQLMGMEAARDRQMAHLEAGTPRAGTPKAGMDGDLRTPRKGGRKWMGRGPFA